MWSCERCTLNNVENFTKCEVCGGPKQVSMPVIHDLSSPTPDPNPTSQSQGMSIKNLFSFSSFSSSPITSSQNDQNTSNVSDQNAVNGEGDHLNMPGSYSNDLLGVNFNNENNKPPVTSSTQTPLCNNFFNSNIILQPEILTNINQASQSNQLLLPNNGQQEVIMLSDDEDIYSSVVSNTPANPTLNLPNNTFENTNNRLASNNVANNAVQNDPMQTQSNAVDQIPMSTEENDNPMELNFVEDHFNVPAGNWKCEKCTLINPISSTICEVCQNVKPETSQRSNTNNLRSRVGSSTPISIDVHPENTASTSSSCKAFLDNAVNHHQWNCPRCTLINKNIGICESCSYVHPEFSQYNSQNITEPTTSNNPSTSTSHAPSANTVIHNMEEPASIILQSIEQQEESTHGCFSMEQLRLMDEKKTMEVVKKVQAYCKEKREPFVDDRFPPVKKSLVFPKSKHNYDFEWRRPYHITPRHNDSFHDWTVYRNPQPSDIKQGILGNCWFLSGLAVLAERPELLKHILVTKEFNEEGIYVVRLCITGKWKSVYVDDSLPCDKEGHLVYSQARRNQLWVPLIEKALAKLHGCYEALQAGRSLEGLATLTGAPCESLQLSKSEDDTVNLDEGMIWAKLLSSMEAGFLMGASCGGGNMTSNESEYHEKGLRPRHAYSVLDVTAAESKNGPVRLIQLRNPWGQFSWKGDWCDGSPKWKDNPALTRRLNPYRSQDGTFWMNLEDMIKYFDCVDICKIYGKDWVSMRVSGTFPSKASDPISGFYLNVFSSSELEFCLFQQLARSQYSSNRYPVDACIAIFRATKNNGKYLLGALIQCAPRQVKKQIYCNYFLEPGNYIVICVAFNHWLSGFVTANGGQRTIDQPVARQAEYVLVLHSSKKVEFDKTSNIDTSMSRVISKIAANKGDQKSLRDGVTCYVLSRGWGGLIAVMENRHPNMHFHVKCDCVESTNVVSTRGKFLTVDSIPPLHSQVIVVLSQLDSYSGFSITHKLTHRLSPMSSLKDWAPPSVLNQPIITRDLVGLHKPIPL